MNIAPEIYSDMVFLKALQSSSVDELASDFMSDQKLLKILQESPGENIESSSSFEGSAMCDSSQKESHFEARDAQEEVLIDQSFEEEDDLHQAVDEYEAENANDQGIEDVIVEAMDSRDKSLHENAFHYGKKNVPSFEFEGDGQSFELEQSASFLFENDSASYEEQSEHNINDAVYDSEEMEEDEGGAEEALESGAFEKEEEEDDDRRKQPEYEDENY